MAMRKMRRANDKQSLLFAQQPFYLHAEGFDTRSPLGYQRTRFRSLSEMSQGMPLGL